MIAIIMAIIIDVVVIIITVIIIQLSLRNIGEGWGSRKEALSLSALEPPDFDPDSHYRKLLPLCPLQADLLTVLSQPVPRHGQELGCALCDCFADPSPITLRSRAWARFPPCLESAVVCVASWKHSRHEALLNHSFPRAGICCLLNKRCPGWRLL